MRRPGVFGKMSRELLLFFRRQKRASFDHLAAAKTRLGRKRASAKFFRVRGFLSLLRAKDTARRCYRRRFFSSRFSLIVSRYLAILDILYLYLIIYIRDKYFRNWSKTTIFFTFIFFKIQAIGNFFFIVIFMSTSELRFFVLPFEIVCGVQLFYDFQPLYPC